ncbi:hypothetical protein ES705_50405 [subsurface metagenome]
MPTPDPDTGYEFDAWDPVLPADTDQINADVTYTANFEKDDDQWATVTFVAGDNGSLIGTTEFEVLKGTLWSVITVPTPDPDTGYEFDAWDPVLPADTDQINADVTYTANFADVPCDEYLKSAIIKLTWYDPGTSDSSMIKTDDVPYLNSLEFSGILVVEDSHSGMIEFSVDLTDPYDVGSNILIVTLEANPDTVVTQGLFDVEIYLDGVLFVTVPMNSQGKVGSANVVFAASDTVMTNNCEESIEIDVTDVVTITIEVN